MALDLDAIVAQVVGPKPKRKAKAAPVLDLNAIVAEITGGMPLATLTFPPGEHAVVIFNGRVGDPYVSGGGGDPYAQHLSPVDQRRLAVWGSAHTFHNADLRWAADRLTGLSDAEFRERMTFEFTGEGGSTVFGMRFWHKPSLRVGVGSWFDLGDDVITSGAVLRIARDVLGIPYPRQS